MEIIGLIPAGGKATRLGKLPFSKEVYPINPTVDNNKPRVISEYLLKCYRTAGIEQIYFIIRKGKWDIPDYFGDGKEQLLNIGYLIMNKSYGVPFTLDQAYPFIQGKYVALGFPDIIFQPENAYSELKTCIQKTNADIILGIFPIKKYQSWDRIEFDSSGRISGIFVKQKRPDLEYGWTIAIWNPVFSEFMHEQLKLFLKNFDPEKETREIFAGDIIDAAIRKGLKTDYVIFEKGTCIDLGTPNELIKTLKNIYT
jgi:glucose-1-phosphate thymidylyltransferase